MRDGDEWVINGEKWFSSNARFAEFLIVMAVTDPEVSAVPGHVDVHRARPRRPGVEIVRNVGIGAERRGRTAPTRYIRYNDVRVPADHLLGGEGQAFVIAQTRLGGGRIHHAMRTDRPGRARRST